MKSILTLALVAMIATTASAQTNVWSTSNTTGGIYAHDTSGNLTVTTITSLTTFALPTSVAVSSIGEAYIAFQGQTALDSGVYHLDAQGSVNTFYQIGTDVTGLAFDPQGNLWATDNGASSIYEMSPTGVIQSTIALTAPAAHIAISSFNQVFVDSTTAGIVQMTTSGTVMRTIAAPGGASNLMGLAVDRNGDCWAAYNSGTVVKINRTTGAFDVTIPNLPAPTGVAVNNFNEVYIANNDAQGAVLYCTSSGLINTSINVGSPVYGVALDGNGDVWCTTNTSPVTLNKYDRWTLSPLANASITGSANNVQIGDFTGYIQSNILRPNDDFDNDQSTNQVEVDAGSDPVNAGSTPTNPQPIQNGVARPGATVTLSCRQYGDATLGFAAGGSQGNNSQNYISVPGTQMMIPLENDAFFSFVANNFWHFQNFGGYLDANGNVLCQINVPNDNNLVGQNFYFAFITLDNNNVQPVVTVSNNVQVTVQP